MAKSVEERIRESQERIEREKAKQKAWVAAENRRKRKERNHRLYTIGGSVEAMLKGHFSFDPLDEFEKTVIRLIQIGMAVDEVAGHPVDAQIIKYFLKNQDQRGHYFSDFVKQRETKRDGDT